MNWIAIQCRNVLAIKEMGQKVSWFADFCQYDFMAMSAHTHAYWYPLLESGMKTGIRMITLCRKDRVLLSKQK